MSEEILETAVHLGCNTNRELERELVRPLLEISGRNRHQQCINALAFSADGELLASGSKDATVRLWDIRTGEQLAKAPKAKPCWPIDALAISKNGGQVAYVTRGKKKAEQNLTRAFLWDVHGFQTIEVARKQRHKYEFGIPCFSPDETAVAFAERSILLFDTGTGELLEPKFDSGLCSALAFSPNGEMLASDSRSGTIQVWDVATGKLMNKLGGHSQWAGCLTFSPDGRSLISTSDDGTMRFWQVNQGQAAEAAHGDQDDTLYHLGFLFDGRRFATFHASDKGGYLQIKSMNNRTETRRWETDAWSFLTYAALSPDGHLLATGDYEGNLKVWRVDQLFGEPEKQSRTLTSTAAGD